MTDAMRETFEKFGATSEEVNDKAKKKLKTKATAGEGPASSAPSRVSLLPVTEIKFDKASKYLLKGLINPGDLSVWFGPSGCGKTFAALHIAVAIAQGRSVFGRRVRQAKVALFALEGSASFGKRLAAVQTEHKEKIEGLFIHAAPLGLFADPKLVDEVIDAIKACGAQLAIFDTLSRTMNGANENAADDMTHMVGLFDRIRAETGAHVMLIHHTGKDEERGSRGHSSLRGAVDTEVKFHEDPSRIRIATISKSRDDLDSTRFAFKLKPVPLGLDDDKEQITSCVVEEVAVPSPAARSKPPSENVTKLLGLMREIAGEDGKVRRDELTAAALKKGPWASKDAVRKAIEAAAEGKRIGKDRAFVWEVM